MKNQVIFSLKIFAIIFGLAFFIGCKTNKNTAMYRGWHNMNSRYNGYFYSNENLKESVKKVEKSIPDDFSKLLPLFIYPNNQTAKNYFADFDKTIKKSSSVIQRHAITTKKTKEEIPNACRWIDENYMLIGKAHLYKRDLFSALEVFEYVSKKYPNPEAKYQGFIWMIRADNEIGSYSLSELIIDDLRNAKDVPAKRSFQQELAAVTADFHIKREDYTPAIKQLTKAISLTKKKQTKARYIYVLAQLYEKLGDNKKASQYYSMVPKLHPSYEMIFNARIKHAMLFDSEQGDSKIIVKRLHKMLKDDKNIEFRDQIYYALAVLAAKEKNTSLAIEHIAKSIETSTTNNTQKALSYLFRAEIQFESLNYTGAAANYDSTLSILPIDYPNHKQIEEKKNSLAALVLNLNTIALEDSLQRLSKMSEKEREAAINKLIDKIETEEKQKIEAQEMEVVTLQPNKNKETSTSAWYFYNPTTINNGKIEFMKKWGSRKLEDSWRRSEKEQTSGIVPEVELEDVKDSLKRNTAVTNNSSKNKKDSDVYLKNIPSTPEAVEKSNEKIIDAFYNLGFIYKEQLLNNQKSVEATEELLKRYPDCKYKLSAYYQLYRTYLIMKNNSQSEYYKNLLLNKYPDSEYAKIIRNPEYAKDIMASKSEVEQFYNQTYQLYSESNYTRALENCLKAELIYLKNDLMPQFSFIKALCIGRTQDLKSFQNALNEVVIKFPKAPVKDKALEMLEVIKKQNNVAIPPSTTDSISSKPKYTYKEDSEYLWVTVALNGKGDIDQFKTNLSDLNSESFSLDDLSISNVFLDSSHQLISVKNFIGKTKAMSYYQFMKDKPEAFENLEPGTFQSFIISVENYTIFYKEKNIEGYLSFFSQNFK
jgi:tetratricopeptide (TPR) repeat protein